MQVEEALSALADVMRRLDVPLWRRPESPSSLEDLQRAVAPLRLPADMVVFWREVDVNTLNVYPYPGFESPEWALQSWTSARDELPDAVPLALVDVGYQSHDVMAVELDVDDVAGGALFEYFGSSLEEFERRFDTFGDWIAYLVTLIDAGLFERGGGGYRGPGLTVPGLEHEGQAEALRPTPGRHPVHGDALRLDADFAQWPAHWRRATRLHRPDVG